MKKVYLKNVKKFKGNTEEFYIARVRINNKVFNLTYDCKKDNLIIHEWFHIPKNELESIATLIKESFQYLMIQELFPAAVALIDRYNAAISMDFPDEQTEKYNKEMKKMLEIIENAGLSEDFAEYCCVV